jgi:hypothetical protein
VILVDTSIWIDHFRKGEPELARLLAAARVLVHPFVICEIALGHVKRRARVLSDLAMLPSPVVAENDEVLAFIDRVNLSGTGVGYVDAHLLASVTLTGGAKLWTRDGRLAAVATRLGLSR